MVPLLCRPTGIPARPKAGICPGTDSAGRGVAADASPDRLHARAARAEFSSVSRRAQRAAQAFGVAYRVPAEQQELYRKSFVNLPFINGEDSWSLPIPSAFVADRDGVVRYASVHANFTERDDPEMLLGRCCAEKVSLRTSETA